MQNINLSLEFNIPFTGKLFTFEYESKPVCECSFDKNELSFSLLYDFNDTPLQLVSQATLGDKVTVKIFDYRIELYIGDVLCDEEWPCGSNFLDKAVLCADGVIPKISSACPHDISTEPSVLYSFCNAEGWKPDKNVFVGDCMPYYDGERYHCMYLYDRHHHGSKWKKGAHQWAHVSTEDFVTWQAHPMAVEITHPKEGSICTGSYIKHGFAHYLFYTIRTMDTSPAPICRSISQDGYHYEKDNTYRFELSEKYVSSSARDPKIIKGEDGLFHMLITTSVKSTQKGCLAHLVSSDLEEWCELDEPIYVSPDENQPECPDYFKLGDCYYLVFSHRSVGQYLYSKQPFSGWIKPKNEIIPCESVPKCAVVGEKAIFAGYKGNGKYAGTLTFKTATRNEDGELIFLE